jgi:phage-related protein
VPAISVGSVEVDVLPNVQGIYGRLRSALVPAATRAGRDAGDAAGRAFGPAMQGQVDGVGLQIGRQIGRQIASQVTASLRTAIRDGVTQGGRTARPAATRQGEQTGGAFARSLRARLEAAFRSMPRLDVRLSDTGVDADLARLRARLETLAGKTVGIDIDAATARAQAADIEERLRRIGAVHPNVAVRADTAAAIAQLQALQTQIDEVTADPARIRVETDGTFGQRLRAQVQAAEASLPNINLTADSSAAEVEIARLRAQLTALRDVRIGVDMDAATATARIEAIQARLQRLAASDADVAIRVDTAAAVAQLAAIQAAVNRLDGQTANVNVNVSGMQMLVTAALAFGPAIIPALPVVAAGLGAVTAAAVAAGAGIGAIALVAAPAFKGIASALQAQKSAQDAAANSTYKGGAASGQGARQALSAAGAQQSLATAHRNAARQISQAQQAVGDAVRNAAEANRRAADQVKQAQQGLADAVQQAADRQRDAADRVVEAERSLADAQRTARQAQADLTQARRDAADELRELSDRVAGAQLSERDAALSVQEAEVRLRQVKAQGSKASAIEQQRAQLAYDQAVQRLKEQQQETKDLSAEKKAADKAGVEGSETVRDAQQRIADADRAVADQQKGLAKARQEQQRAAVEGARSIAEAQAKVAESQRAVTRTQEDGARSVARAQENLAAAQASAADSIASAQRQIASSSLSAAGGIDQAAIAQAKYQAELDKLTPSARETFDAFVGLRSAFGKWSKSLQPKVMPIFTRALNGMRKALPGITPFVKEAAGAVGDLQDRVSRGFKSPWWKSFKKDLQGSVRPAIIGLGVSFGRVFKGMAGIVQAFFPHMDSISERMQKITGRFANWGTSLKGSPEFERFLDYSSTMAPKLGDALGKIAGAFLSIGQALSPVSGPLLFLLSGLAEAIGIIAEAAPWMVQGIWLAIVAMRVWTIAQWALNAAMSANPISLIIIGIVALVAIGIYAFNKFPWFRDLVLKAWAGIKTASLWLWNTVLKPFFTWFGGIVVWLWQRIIRPYIGFLIAYWKTVAQVAVWLWNTVLKPFFVWFGGIVVWLWQKIIKPYIGFLIAYWRKVADVAIWLWKTILAPAFRGIGAIISWWWTNIVKRYFGFVRGAISVLGDVFRWLWQKAVKPAWSGISGVIGTIWRDGIKPAFDRLKAAVGKVGDAFEAARKAIKIAWDKLKGIARTPVQYVVDVVYNNGIRGVWNKVAGAFGAKKLEKFTFARGGIMPGYTPGKDVHKFVSPTGGQLELSGGEAIMRPEFTRAVGSGFVGAMNSIARSRGAQGVKAALAPVFGGNPTTPTDRSLKYAGGGVYPVQRFEDGGIFGWIGSAASKAAGAGSAAWNGIKAGASWLGDSLEESARAGVKKVVNPLLKSFPGMDTGFGRMIRKVPDRIIDTLFGYTKEADKKGGGGIGGPKIQAATRWAKTQNRLPYQWGGNGNPSWDCSGFMSAIESVIRGQKPHRRWSTHAFKGGTPPGWVKNGQSAFKVGITHAGVGHTAGTIGKTKVESRGGDGVVVGSRARGYSDRLFTSWYGFKPGSYDSGGYLQPGLNLAYNGTGRPEPVFTTGQANALTSMAGRGAAAGPASFQGDLYLDSGEFLGRVRGEAQQVVDQNNGQLLTALGARPTRR